MDLRALLAVETLLVLLSVSVASGNVVFQVHSKLKDRQRSLSALREHDSRRHGRLLSVDLPLAGNGNPSDTGLYYAKIGLGNPSNDYYVQVDTGSDTLWVNCAGCDKCPTKSDLGINLVPYDPKASSTGSTVPCDQDFCAAATNSHRESCQPNAQCQYNVTYGDGSSTAGYFIEDNIHLAQVTGNLQSSLTDARVKFGCAVKQSGDLGSSNDALSGLMGFGQANASVLSQLAAAGKVKKIFAHCLDSKEGGGIFAIGEIVEPKVKSTPLVPHQAHYNVVMKGLDVGGEPIQISTSLLALLDSDKQAIIDSGTTLAYLPDYIYNSVMAKITAKQPGLKLVKVEDQFTCFEFSGNVDDGFPPVNFQFADSLSLTVRPHDYLFQIKDDKYCFGWMSSTMQSKDGQDVTLLGDMVLSDMLVVYDLVNQTVGWVDYNCSSSVKVKDEKSGAIYSVGAHDLSSKNSASTSGITLTWLLSICATLYSFLL